MGSKTLPYCLLHTQETQHQRVTIESSLPLYSTSTRIYTTSNGVLITGRKEGCKIISIKNVDMNPYHIDIIVNVKIEETVKRVIFRILFCVVVFAHSPGECIYSSRTLLVRFDLS